MRGIRRAQNNSKQRNDNIIVSRFVKCIYINIIKMLNSSKLKKCLKCLARATITGDKSYANRRMMTVSFCPPKPKLLLMATSTLAARAWLGT